MFWQLICYKSTSKRAGGPRLWGGEVVSASIHSALIPSKIIHANLLGKGRDPAGQVLVSWSETLPVAVHLRGYLEWVSVLRRYKKLFPKSPWHHGDSLTFPWFICGQLVIFGLTAGADGSFFPEKIVLSESRERCGLVFREDPPPCTRIWPVKGVARWNSVLAIHGFFFFRNGRNDSSNRIEEIFQSLSFSSAQSRIWETCAGMKGIWARGALGQIWASQLQKERKLIAAKSLVSLTRGLRNWSLALHSQHVWFCSCGNKIIIISSHNSSVFQSGGKEQARILTGLTDGC